MNENLIVREITEEKTWEDFLWTHLEASFLQSWSWGEFQKKIGHEIWRQGFYRGDKLVGVMLLASEPAKRGKYLTVPGGPIIDWNDEELRRKVVEEMKRIGKESESVFVRVRPQLEETDESKKIFANLGFVKAPMHLHAELTHRLDLTKSADELLIAMRKNTRSEIKKAGKLGIEVRETKDPEAIKKFYEIQLETAKRQNFTPFGEQYLTEQFAVLAAKNEVVLYESFYEGELLAQAFVIFYHNEAVYHYGTGTLLGRKHPGAYLIQWMAIQEAQRRGMKIYNFWGVAPEGNSEHRFAGLSLFKRGFGGDDYAYLSAQDLVVEPLKYKMVHLIESTRKKIRRV
ncbi:MAG: peptidoglycan bridge formation glycyltransferase FemA/FemB family protein [Pseudomonadales bacterium]|jgi:lipid II:glycine glycyltransferase (peptidoglycan interpeptide bridge formation enzyme)|nr:peptidoglycan bridge formation glycyltransferase FemA/FemB family protein [Pseudomonadales bacterium]